MGKDVKDWTNEELVTDFMNDNGIYNSEVLQEICARANMSDEWDAANGETFERVVQMAAQELCPEICRA